MSEHLYTHRKTSDQSASIPQQSLFQPRPFVVQAQTEEQSSQPDLKTALQRAKRYGHSLDRIKFAEAPVQRPVPRIVQAKLTIGQPSDRYEQEADRVASEVVQRINAESTSSAVQTVQRRELIAPPIPILSSQPGGFGEIKLKPLVQRQNDPEVGDVKMEAEHNLVSEDEETKEVEGYLADDEMSEDEDSTKLDLGKGRKQFIRFNVAGQHGSMETVTKDKKQYIMDKARKALPRSFREEREGQTLRHISTVLFAQFGGEEIQCALFEGILYISSNQNNVNKKLRDAITPEKAAIKLLKGGQKKLLTKRQKRHGRKLRKGLENEDNRGGKMPVELKQAITENSVIVTPAVEPERNGLHAERRINEYINQTKQAKEAVSAADYPGKGVKRPCAVCYHKLFQGDNRSAGPLWSSKAATIGTTVNEVTPEMKLTTVTKAKDGTLTIDYDTESDSDSDSSEVESPRKKETGSAVSKNRTREEDPEDRAAQEIEQRGRKRRRMTEKMT